MALLWCWTNCREILIFPKHKHWSVSDKQSRSWQKHWVSATVYLGCEGKAWEEPGAASGGVMSIMGTFTFPLVLLSILGPRCLGPYDLHFSEIKKLLYHEAWKEQQLFSVTPKGFSKKILMSPSLRRDCGETVCCRMWKWYWTLHVLYSDCNMGRSWQSL